MTPLCVEQSLRRVFVLGTILRVWSLESLLWKLKEKLRILCLGDRQRTGQVAPAGLRGVDGFTARGRAARRRRARQRRDRGFQVGF